MYIVAGLGNPTSQYRGTRHNVGFDVVDEIAGKHGISMETLKFKALCGKGIIGGEKVLLMKPQTYMNNSGEALREAADFYKVDKNKEIIIIYDDISLAEGQLRIRSKGSAGGHNGMKSIIAHLGTDGFTRIRVGIGAKPAGMDLADYVLGRFSAMQKVDVEQGIRDGAEALEWILEKDIQAAMNRFNTAARS